MRVQGLREADRVDPGGAVARGVGPERQRWNNARPRHLQDFLRLARELAGKCVCVCLGAV